MICEDTVLFPEGGGQNSDHGELAGRRVLQVVVIYWGQDGVISMSLAVILMVAEINNIIIRWTGRETRQFTL